MFNEIEKEEGKSSSYKQSYFISPTSSFIVKPSGGELPYSIAYKSPRTFVNAVVSQDINKYEIKNISNPERARSLKSKSRRSLQASSSIEFTYTANTKRPIINAINPIKEKLYHKLRLIIGDKYKEKIYKGLQQPQIQDFILSMIHNDKIKFKNHKKELNRSKSVPETDADYTLQGRTHPKKIKIPNDIFDGISEENSHEAADSEDDKFIKDFDKFKDKFTQKTRDI